jgi:hypothetical protein
VINWKGFRRKRSSHGPNVSRHFLLGAEYFMIVVGRSVGWLIAAGPRHQDVCSPRRIYVFRSGASFSTRGGSLSITGHSLSMEVTRAGTHSLIGTLLHAHTRSYSP